MTVVMKTIKVIIAMFFLVLGIAFGQSSDTKRIALTASEKIDVGFGGPLDQVYSVIQDSAGDWYISGVYAPYYRPGFHAAVEKLSPTGKLIWRTLFGDTLSQAGEMVYDKATNSVFVACMNGIPGDSNAIAGFDGSDGHKIWEVPKGAGLFYSLITWQGYLLALQEGTDATLFLLDKSDGSVVSDFPVSTYATGYIKMRTLGDSLWVFAQEFAAVFSLPSGQLLWKMNNPCDATLPAGTRGTVDSNGNAYITTSDVNKQNALTHYVAVKLSPSGTKLWRNQWYGWPDSNAADGLNQKNFVMGITVDESLGIAAVFGVVQRAGTKWPDSPWGSAYTVLLSMESGDTLLTSKMNDDWDDSIAGTYWNDGFFNQKNQLILLGFASPDYGVPANPNIHIPEHNFIKVFNIDGVDAVRPEPQSAPNTFALSQNYPNPFNPTTQINYSVSQSGYVTLKVYNTLGQEVATLFSGTQHPGNYVATFDGSRFASGLYFYRLQADKAFLTKKMLLMK